MADVFISYARVDEPQAKVLADALRAEGVDVWWDADLVGGDEYRSKIRELISSAKKVVVLWSRTSVDSGFVIDEASEARRQHKLVPLSIDGSPPPFGFGNLHTLPFEEPQRDIARVVAALGRAPAPGSPSPSRHGAARRSLLAAGAALTVLVLAGAGYWLMTGDPQPPPPQHAAPRLALVIGNSSYAEGAPIPNAQRDAERVSEALQKRGFKVIKLINADRSQMLRAIGEFETTLGVVGGVGLFYFAGNGGYIEGRDLMLPVDVSTSAIKKRGVNISRLQNELKGRTTAGIRDDGTVIIYSTSKGQRAADGPPNGYSPFNDAFINALAHEEDELGDFFRRIRTTLAGGDKRVAADRQTPYLEGASNAKFYFNKSERDASIGVLRILVFDSCRDDPTDNDTPAPKSEPPHTISAK